MKLMILLVRGAGLVPTPSHLDSGFPLGGRNSGDEETSIRIIPVFSIEFPKKDLSLIKEIQSFFGVGTIRIRQRAGKSTVIYSVQSLKNLTEIIIPYFKQYSVLT